MASNREDDLGDYRAVRGEPVATFENLLRWERIKLREAAQDAVKLLEAGAVPTREYLDYRWTSDTRLQELRERMARLRARIAELEAIRAEAAMTIE